MIDRAPFGHTGHESSRVIFGAACLWSMDQERADALLDVLLEHGVNHLDVERLLGTCAERSVAVQTIKAVARRRWTDDDEPHFSWYEPLSDPDALGRAVRHVLAHPGLFLDSSSDARVLRPTLEAAAAGGPAPTADELEADRLAQGILPLFDGAELERI